MKELQALFYNDDRAELLFGKFGYNQFTLNNIPSNSRHRLINEFLEQDINRLEDGIKDIVKNYDQLLEYLTFLGSKPPTIITTAAEFTLTSEIVKKLEDASPNLESIGRDFELAKFWHVKPDEGRIKFAFSDCMNEILTSMCVAGLDINAVDELNALIKLFSGEFDWHLELEDTQNLYHELITRCGKDLRQTPEKLRRALYDLGKSLKFSDEMLVNVKC